MHQKTNTAIGALAVTAMSYENVRYGVSQDQVREVLEKAIRSVLEPSEGRLS
jgi:hypothetical protein